MNFLFFTFVTALSFPASNAFFSSLFDYFDDYYAYDDSVPSDKTFDYFDPFDFADFFQEYPDSDESNITEIKDVEVLCDGCNIKINCTNCTVGGLPPPLASTAQDSIENSTSTPTSTTTASGSGSTSLVAKDEVPSAASSSTQTIPTTVSAPTVTDKANDSAQENSMTTSVPQSNSIEVNSTEASTETTTAGTK